MKNKIASDSTTIWTAIFDMKIWTVDTKEEVYEAFFERIKNAETNTISMFTEHFCSPEELKGLKVLKNLIIV